MAYKILGAIATIGSTSGALDTVVQSTLSTGDMAIAIDSSEEAHIYRYDASSTAAESDPEVVMPDAGGTGRWILSDLSLEDLKVYGNAVLDGTLLATGLVTATDGVNIVGTLQFDGAGPAITVVKDDDTMADNSAVALATQQSIKQYVDAQTSGVTQDMMAGFSVPTTASYKDGDEIYLTPARYHHNGTTEQIVKWDATLTYTFSALGASSFSYLYLDDSAIVTEGTNVISATELTDSITPPVWNADQLGYYNDAGGGTPGPDKCIGAFRTTSGSVLRIFWQYNNDIVWNTPIEIFTSLTTSYAAKTFYVPSFCNMVYAHLYFSSGSSCVTYGQHPDGTADNYLMRNRSDDEGDNQADSFASDTRYYLLDNSAQHKFKVTVGTSNITGEQLGYTLPRGII